METTDAVPQILKVLSDKKCLNIIKILSIKPSYNKELAELLTEPETRISEKVGAMKQVGLVVEYWVLLNKKPIKMYRLDINKLSFSFLDGKITVVTSPSDHADRSLFLEAYKSTIPHVSKFYGRKEELNILKESEHVLVTGIPGIGKTTLVAKYATETGRQIFWHSIRESDTLKYLIMKLAVFLKDCGLEHPLNLIKNEPDYRYHLDISMYYLRKSGALFIVDDLQRCRDPEIISFLQDLIRSEPKITVKMISTGTLPFNADSVSFIHLGGLDRLSSAELSGGSINPGDVYKITGGHPLMIKLFNTLQGRLNDVNWRSKSFMFREILDALGNNISDILHNLSYFRGDIQIKELDTIFGKIDRSVLEEAQYLGFLQLRDDNITMSDFIREIIYGMTERKQDKHRKIANYYLNSERSESQIEGLYHIIRCGDDNSIAETLNKIIPFLIDSGFLENVLAELKGSLAHVGEGLAREWICLWMGKILLMKGEHEKALSLFRQVRKSSLSMEVEVKAMSGESQIFEELGEPKKSIELLQKALSKTRGHDDLLEANILLNLSGALVMEGKISLAHAYLQRTITVYNSKGEKRNLYVSLANFAWTTYLSDSIINALPIIDQAIEGFLSMKAFYSYADCIVEKAIFLSALGKHGLADDLFQEAIQIFESTSYNPRDLVFCLSHKIMNDIMSANIDGAKIDLRSARRVTGTTSDKGTIGMLRLAEAQLFLKNKNYSKSILKVNDAKELLSKDFPSFCIARLTEYTIMLSMGKQIEADRIKSQLAEELNLNGCFQFLKNLENIKVEMISLRK